MKYFKNFQTIEELKKEYKKLAFELHPDCGGNHKDFIEMSAEYEKLLNDLTGGANTIDKFKFIVDELIKYSDLTVEICGSWIWISGNTKEHKQKLKELKCKWANKKAMWYYTEDKPKKRHKTMTMEEIRLHYGSEIHSKVLGGAK